MIGVGRAMSLIMIAWRFSDCMSSFQCPGQPYSSIKCWPWLQYEDIAAISRPPRHDETLLSLRSSVHPWAPHFLVRMATIACAAKIYAHYKYTSDSHRLPRSRPIMSAIIYGIISLIRFITYLHGSNRLAKSTLDIASAMNSFFWSDKFSFREASL